MQLLVSYGPHDKYLLNFAPMQTLLHTSLREGPCAGHTGQLSLMYVLHWTVCDLVYYFIL